ncbi:hypothetical protein [Thermomonospora umbrina]|uniref:Uncharacterized protein n=1 Tax=Thermomonospora umbrina TaxID=111806 RepID=A0A3D9SMP3_9ACTN|nr:hypothetical protein [Thermomonospora umbrina]REE95203.1 hypothetical protein DFJ69_0586 [Thermomonospora umbrina]
MAVPALVTVTALVLTPGAAQATEYPETWLPDNRTHSYCITDDAAAPFR